MKRFWTTVTVAEDRGGHAIALDGRAVRTPARAPLVVPTRALGEAVADEWRAAGERIDPRAMPLTGLSNAAIDRIAPDPAAHVAALARYGESDLVAYRAEGPASLVACQAHHWDPIIAWARGRFDIEVAVTTGIVYRPQPASTLARLHAAVASYDPFALAGLNPVVTVTGSLLIALALADRSIDADAAWAAGQLDELWLVEQWGAPELAAAARAARRADLEAGARFLSLLQPGL